jgi:hypothetical protein
LSLFANIAGKTLALLCSSLAWQEADVIERRKNANEYHPLNEPEPEIEEEMNVDLSFSLPIQQINHNVDDDEFQQIVCFFLLVCETIHYLTE